MPSVSSTSAACFIVAQSDWLPMMMATGLAATKSSSEMARCGRKTKARIIDSGPAPASRERPAAAEYLRVPLKILRMPPCADQPRSSDDIGGQLVLDEADAVAQHQLALLEALDLQDVRTWRDLQRFDRRVEIAVLLPQPRELRPQFAFFLFGHCRCRIHLGPRRPLPRHP